MQVVCVYLWGRGGKGGVGAYWFVLGNIAGKICYIKASFFKSDTSKSVIICVFHDEIWSH